MRAVTTAQDTKFLAEAEKLRAEAAKLNFEAARADFEARAAGHAAEQVEIARDREAHRRRVELSSDSYHGVYRLVGGISDSSVGAARDSIVTWRRLNPEAREFKVVICSPGGDVVAGVSLFDVIRTLSADGVHVTTVADGITASMGAILTQAGDTRIIMPNASFMLHEAAFFAGGKTSEVEDRADWVRMIEDRFAAIIAERSTLSAKQLKNRWSRKDWWMLAEEALRHQFFDRLGTGADLL